MLKEKPNKTFNILSIDGGGLRGVYPAHLLLRIQKELDLNYQEYFDLVIGTSTGSIIAAAITCNIDLNKIIKMYEEYGPKIFPDNGKFGIFSSKFSEGKKILCDELENVLGEIRFKDIKTPSLIIPSTNICEGKVFVFKSKYSSEFVRDPEILVRDAVLASCSAPTYFDPTRVGEYLLSDGGLWANNPAMLGYVDAQRRFSKKHDEIKILSIGTGTEMINYERISEARLWGILSGWKTKKFIKLLFSIQSQSIHNYLSLLFPEATNKYLRLDFTSNRNLPLDDSKTMQDFKSIADSTFTYEFCKINNFINN